MRLRPPPRLLPLALLLRALLLRALLLLVQPCSSPAHCCPQA
jgi:hypothetical protein